jgi:hypothetical protein
MLVYEGQIYFKSCSILNNSWTIATTSITKVITIKLKKNTEVVYWFLGLVGPPLHEGWTL